MKKLLFYLSFLMLFTMIGAVFAGITGKISGIVKDAETGETLMGVNVVVTGTTLGAATDRNGNYFILNVPPGGYTVEASMMGYEKLSQTDVKVSSDHTTLVGFELKQTTLVGAAVTI